MCDAYGSHEDISPLRLRGGGGIHTLPKRSNARETKERASERIRLMIIAVDFDGVLCDSAFPDIGKPHYEMISLVRQLIDDGHEVILWTCRVETELDAAVEWCKNYGLNFCAVNDNAPSNREQFKGVYGTYPRKIYADRYIDDHNLNYSETSAKTSIKRSILLWKEILKTKEN